ncbi:MAG: FHA domain-containing protein [Planctomycetota bacterium]|nr:MAG: FHA domain-containing protein [Planctomycetota bacterium]REJ93297.1 MAG: FHA domain-containing protein [Planctomycetota bacterium]REK30210.1 MAG: FHA domain-containing protein [Planctomycetota bacterium]REK49252.1 MAG: FHA domain-containing protein [Planctomycetota bacterium]
MARLIRIDDDGDEQHRLEEDRIVLGRHPDCQIQLDHGSVSRQHAQIVREADQFFVEDLGSRNGTLVNEQVISGRRQLLDGDELKICDVAFRFAGGDPQAGQEATWTGLASDESSRAVMVDDQSGSRIMSKLEMTSDGSYLQLEANPQAKLQAVLDISRDLSRTLSLDEVLPKMLDSLFKIFIQADRGFIVLKNEENGALVPKAVKFRRPEQDDTIRISRTIVNEVIGRREAILSADAASDERFQMSQSIADYSIRSMMCAPLMDSDGSVLGVIQIDTLNQKSRFNQEDLAVLAGVAAPAGMAVENAQLHDDRLRQQAVERDLEMAHRVQQGLLPAAPPEVPGYRFFDFYDPAKHVGGDFYDYIFLPGGKVAVVLADVSGKGVSAALLMAKLSAEARYCLASESEPAAAIRRLNKTFSGSGWEDRFVTLVLVVLDPAAGRLQVVNAGHLPPLVRHGGDVQMPGEEFAGLPLGVVTDYEYESFPMELAEGDCIAMFTDGFSEAMNADGELYGLDRLKARFADELPDAEALGRHLLDEVEQFVAGQPQSDDMCLVCFGRAKTADPAAVR